MSSTRKGARKSGADNYPTPEWAIARFLEEWQGIEDVGPRWLEPAVGDGVIAELVDRYRKGIEWTTCDIRDTTPALKRLGLGHDHHVGDFFDLPAFDPDAGNRWDCAIFNPPFRLTMEFIQRCLKLAPVVVAMQRVNYLGTADRNEWFRDNLPDVYVIPDRVSYTGDGSTDSVENAWHVWGPHPKVAVSELHLLKTTPLEERRRGRRRIVRSRDEKEVALDALFESATDWDGPLDGDLWTPEEVRGTP